MSSYYRQSLENYLKTLEIKALKVADVGGASNPVKDRVKSWDVADVEYYDNEEESALLEYTFIDLNLSAQFVRAGKEIVFCLEVMEYIWNPKQALTHIADMLINNGTLYITFPSLYPPHNPIKHDYLRYTKQGAVKLLEEAGFKIEQITPREIHNKDLYGQYVNAERYRVKGAHEVGTLYDSGYIIKAIKI